MARATSPITLSDLGEYNSLYLATAPVPSDPTLVWGTYVEMAAMEAFLAAYQRPDTPLVSAAHALLRAAAIALTRYPRFNRRVVGRRVYPLDGVHLLMPMLRSRGGEVDMVFLRDANSMSLAMIGTRLWEALHEARREAERLREPGQRGDRARRLDQWRRALVHRLAPLGLALSNRFRIPNFAWNERLQATSALVNYLVFPDSPPLTFFKPSTLRTNGVAVHVSLGPTRAQVLVEEDQPVVRRVAPLFVKADHRVVDTPQIAAFVATLRDLWHQPAQLLTPDEQHPAPPLT
ncbi:MAG TPA: 2-oxo acid dehydrogenase subunit E2 [Pirellulaceae bacterium]